jgi:hypothetical protein
MKKKKPKYQPGTPEPTKPFDNARSRHLEPAQVLVTPGVADRPTTRGRETRGRDVSVYLPATNHEGRRRR